MNLIDHHEQEEFFCSHLRDILPQQGKVSLADASYDEEWSAMHFVTPVGPLLVRINETAKTKGKSDDIDYRTGFIARLLAESKTGAAEDYLKKHKSLLEPFHQDFETPVAGPGIGNLFSWDATRKTWPKPFYIQRWVEGPNLAIMPQAKYFHRAGAALRRFHAARFKHYYASLRDAADGETTPRSALITLEKNLKAAEKHLPLLLAKALRKLSAAAEGAGAESAVIVLLNNNYFGSNITIDNLGAISVPDWEKAGIGDALQDFFALKYWTVVDEQSGWYVPHEKLFEAFCEGYGIDEYDALAARPLARALEAQWLLARLETAHRRWETGTLKEPYPEPEFYVSCLKRLADV